jgi:2-polyprenyl-6-methoxyphenol hydroxylase-like FAD-dependent oxidoreductase
MTDSYAAIVVGARCAGSPTAMLLARAGHRVLLVDRATFPSDTVSTHLLHPPAVAALARWGLLERLQATGCPPVTRYSFDLGPAVIAGSPRPADGIATAYGPRRTVLDALLVEAAAEAGADVREGVAVEEVLRDGDRVTGIRARTRDGRPLTARARIVIGADGRSSVVARAVEPEDYDEVPALAALYYAYWSGLPTDGFETFLRAEHGRGWAALPTHDGLTCVVVGWPQDELEANRTDVEGAYLRTFEHAPEFAARIAAARRATRFTGTGRLPGWVRRPHGPGWALVGDAGYHKHPITAFGIADAFRDAEAVAGALDDAWSGRRSQGDAMAAWHQARDASSLPMYHLTADFATLAPPDPEMQGLFAAMQGNQEAMDDFVSVMAGTLAPPAFFAPENVGRIMALAA